MHGGQHSLRAAHSGFRTRKSMLETLVRHLSMVRLTIAAALFALVGCVGLIDSGSPTSADSANELWVKKALPALQAGTCEACHLGSRGTQVAFLLGADDNAKRETLMKFTPAVINLEAPASSRILSKGIHEGPALSAQQTDDILEWIQKEREATISGPNGPPQIRTKAIAPTICGAGVAIPDCPVNEISLEDLGKDSTIPGAKITFKAPNIGAESGLYLVELKVVPGAMGAYLEHPLFISIPEDTEAEPIPDTFDRFNAIKLNIKSTATPEESQLDVGAVSFSNFPPANRIAIYFSAAKIFQDDGSGPMAPGGCKVPDSFETNARTQLNTNCASCHGGANANATSAVDMTGIGQPNATAACAQVRLRMNLQDLNGSSIYVAPAPNNNNHPFRFPDQAAFDAFKNAVNVWANAERTAP